jgi:hypothetical protein
MTPAPPFSLPKLPLRARALRNGWQVSDDAGGFLCECLKEAEATYLAQAANHFPEAVALLRELIGIWDGDLPSETTVDAVNRAEALLLKIDGETGT